MKNSSLSFSLASFIITIVLFLVIVPVSFAQTTVLQQPATIDINNIQSNPPTDVLETAPVPTLYENTQGDDEKDVDVEEEAEDVEDSDTDKPHSFLEKARNALQIKRMGASDSQDDRMRADERDGDREERAEKQIIQKKERINKFFNNINRKMDAAIDRLNTLVERIESRIVKFEERGVDMTDAKQLLETAKSYIISAEESISIADANAQEALSGEPSRESFGNVVSELAKTKESLRNAHTSLVQVISAMKANVSGEKQERVERGKNEEVSPSDENDTGVGETN